MSKVVLYSSSQSQSEPEPELTPQQRQHNHSRQRLLNLLVSQHKTQSSLHLMHKIMTQWHQYTQSQNRCKIIIANRFRERALMVKGLDGIMEYAIRGRGFRERLVMWYWGVLVGGCWRGWKQVVRERRRQRSQPREGEAGEIDIDQRESEVEEMERGKSEVYNERQRSEEVRERVEPKENRVNPGVKGKTSERDAWEKEDQPIQTKQYFDNLIPGQNHKLQPRVPLSSQPPSPHPTTLRHTTPIDPILQHPSSSITAPLHPGFMTANQSRSNLSAALNSSRRSTGSLWGQLGRGQGSRSRRKLAPIVEEVRLPVFGGAGQGQGRKRVGAGEEEQVNRNKTSVQEQPQQHKHQQKQQPQPPITLAPPARQNNRKQSVLALITSCKLLQLSLLSQCMHLNPSPQLQTYRDSSLHTLQQLRSLPS